MKIKAFYHYYLIIRSGLFDKAYYLLEYEDVRKADMDPLWHFVRTGWKEGRNPSPNFDIHFYLINNPDVQQSSINPLIHYIKHGKKEGRNSIPPKKNKNKPTILEKNSREYIPVYTNKVAKTFQINDKKGKIFDNKNFYVPEIIKNLETAHAFDDINYFDFKVSVIVPTMNAGGSFDFLLKMLLNQEGFNEIEVIVVDSGSNDNTLEIARDFGVKIVEIPSEDFSHSYARNLGAENATGDYFLFTVQDALPPSRIWLYELMKALKKFNISAVSCAEIPRKNADLFYRVISWNHYQFLDVNNQDRIFSMPDNPNYLTLRKNGQLSDLACLISSELFLKYKYRFNYAEDLDLGIRLIKDNKKIALLGSTRIIHSHNRPAYYFLKRGYVDNLFLSDIFDDFPISERFYDDVINDMLFSYNYLDKNICKEISAQKFPVNLNELENLIIGKLKASTKLRFSKKLNINKNTYIDEKLKSLIDFASSISLVDKAGLKYDGAILQNLIGFINITFSYLRNTNETIDQDLAEEIKACLFKEISLISGAHLAHCYIKSSKEDRKFMENLHIKLKASI